MALGTLTLTLTLAVAGPALGQEGRTYQGTAKVDGEKLRVCLIFSDGPGQLDHPEANLLVVSEGGCDANGFCHEDYQWVYLNQGRSKKGLMAQNYNDAIMLVGKIKKAGAKIKGDGLWACCGQSGTESDVAFSFVVKERAACSLPRRLPRSTGGS